MKKIFIILAVIGIMTSGCSEWLDVNTDPNVPTDVSTDLLLPAGQAGLAVPLGGHLFNTGGIFAQYWAQAPEANQYNDEETYAIKTDFLDRDYRAHWAGALNDLQRVIDDAAEAENYGDHLAATVLKAYTMQIWVDMLDRIPYSEALQGTAYLNPAWEDGQAVYASLIADIDAALSLITSDSRIATSDMMLDSDLDEWIGFANAQKLRMYMRQRNVADVSNEVNALINAGNFMTVDVAFRGFNNELQKRNPWYETTQDLNTDRNHVATVNMIRFLNANSDPRIAAIYDPAEATDTYEGIYPAEKQVVTGQLTTDFSRPWVDALQPVYIFSLAELYLFIAEAELIFNNDPAAAKTAFDMAVNANLAIHGLSADLTSDGTKPYFFDVSKTSDELFEQIMMQKWVCLAKVNHFEAWCELRRTDIPKYWGDYEDFGDGTSYIPGQLLRPAKTQLPEGVAIANRLPYPDLAVSRNENTPALTGTAGLVNKIWWDAN